MFGKVLLSTFQMCWTWQAIAHSHLLIVSRVHLLTQTKTDIGPQSNWNAGISVRNFFSVFLLSGTCHCPAPLFFVFWRTAEMLHLSKHELAAGSQSAESALTDHVWLVRTRISQNSDWEGAWLRHLSHISFPLFPKDWQFLETKI